ncbi:MAG: nucleotidyl transferase AbiEii/AbiGii toxin family protein [Acidimicrobiales bacterium]
MSIAALPPRGPADRDGARLGALREAVSAMDGARIPYLLMGGVGSAVSGRPRMTEDIDLFVEPGQGRPALDALETAGFSTEERDPRWLFKGWKYDVLVDVIFRSSGDIYLDAEMLERGSWHDFGGCRAHVMAPEDLIVVKAITADEHVPQHWYDALGLLASAEIDWAYLARRARRHGLRRTTSLLLYAESKDIWVPADVTAQLFRALNPCAVRPGGTEGTGGKEPGDGQ